MRLDRWTAAYARQRWLALCVVRLFGLGHKPADVLSEMRVWDWDEQLFDLM